MARRNRKTKLADDLLASPWWISVVLGCIIYIVMRWFIPSLFAASPILIGLAILSQSLAWVPLVGFGLMGLLSFLASIKTHEKNAPYIRVPPDSKTMPGRAAPVTADGWGASNQQMAPATDVIHTNWNVEALRSLEWKRFELLCAKYYEAVGFFSETLRCGADGGIDVKLYKIDPNKPVAVVQCKAWNVYSVGVKEVRELLGVMAHEKVRRGIFITTGNYTKDALNFGASNPIQLLDGPGFVSKIMELPNERQKALLQYAFEGDYTTPTCASCGIKMIKRDSKRGPFWGCLNFPRCRSMFSIKS